MPRAGVGCKQAEGESQEFHARLSAESAQCRRVNKTLSKCTSQEQHTTAHTTAFIHTLHVGYTQFTQNTSERKKGTYTQAIQHTHIHTHPPTHTHTHIHTYTHTHKLALLARASCAQSCIRLNTAGFSPCHPHATQMFRSKPRAILATFVPLEINAQSCLPQSLPLIFCDVV